jgi:hypothetical protein
MIKLLIPERKYTFQNVPCLCVLHNLGKQNTVGSKLIYALHYQNSDSIIHVYVTGWVN